MSLSIGNTFEKYSPSVVIPSLYSVMPVRYSVIPAEAGIQIRGRNDNLPTAGRNSKVFQLEQWKIHILTSPFWQRFL